MILKITSHFIRGFKKTKKLCFPAQNWIMDEGSLKQFLFSRVSLNITIHIVLHTRSFQVVEHDRLPPFGWENHNDTHKTRASGSSSGNDMSRERAWVASTSSESCRVNICWLELCVRFLYTPLTYNNNWRTISIRPGTEDRHPKTHLKTIFSLHFIILFIYFLFFLSFLIERQLPANWLRTTPLNELLRPI